MKIHIILIFAFFLSIQLLNANDIQVRIPDTNAVVGDTILIPVYVDSTLTGENVFSYQLQLQFNSGYAYPIEVVVAGTMTQTWGIPTYNTAVQNKITTNSFTLHISYSEGRAPVKKVTALQFKNAKNEINSLVVNPEMVSRYEATVRR